MYKRLKESYNPYYEPQKWNKNHNLRLSHNCYSYFLNDISPKLVKLYKVEDKNDRKILNPQPGHYCGMTKYVNYADTTCESLNKRVLCDNPHIKIIGDNDECDENHYKGALRVNEGDMYHFYRQDEDGVWSHKDGGGIVNRKDNGGNIIMDIKNIKDSKYRDFCNYYCIPKNKYQDTRMARNNYSEDTLWYKN
jgi:hypothetical protein